MSTRSGVCYPEVACGFVSARQDTCSLARNPLSNFVKISFMPTLQYDQLIQLGRMVLTAAGIPADDAAIVAEDLAEANIVGHDSHGVMRLNQYVDFVRDGHVQPGSRLEVLREGPSFAVVDGKLNLGQVTTRGAVRIGMEKAKATGTATVVVRNCNHIGRLGGYTHDAAKAGMLALMAVNAPGPGQVAPFGGRERRLGTNPISIAAPAGDDPLVLDMTTSATAEGKLRVSKQKGELIPEGLIIDCSRQTDLRPERRTTTNRAGRSCRWGRR